MKVFIKFIIMLLGSCSLLAQEVPSLGLSDSTAMYYFYADDFALEERNDTLGHFQRFNPILLGDFDHNFLGNFGSPHYSLVYTPRIREGLDLGFHNYDGYLVKLKDVPYYNTQKPYTEAFFSAGSQLEAIIKAKFSANYAKRANIYMGYNRINHQGGYDRQRVRHSNYTFSTWYRSPNDQYKLLASWAGNTIKQQNNGGITADSLLDENIQRPFLPVQLSSAQTEYDHNEFSISQYYNPFSKTRKRVKFVVDTLPLLDSIAIETDSALQSRLVKRRIPPPAMIDQPQLPNSGYFRHQLIYGQEKLKFFDANPSYDYYGSFLTNDVGLRNFLRTHKIENQVSLRVFLGGEEGGFTIEPGLTHAVYWIYYEPAKNLRSDLRLTAKAQTKIKDFVRLDMNGHFDLGYRAGDYLFNAKLDLDLKKLGRFTAGAGQQLYAPSWLQERLIISDVLVWNRDFTKSLETYAYGSYKHDKQRFEIAAHYYLLNKLVYFDSESLPAQADKAISIAQFVLKKDFKVGKFHLENKGVAQLISSDIVALPKFVLRSSLFYEDILFKGALQARLGFDVRYNTDFQANRYAPLSGQFYLQNEKTLSFYPISDVFLDLKVKQFRAFFKVENISQLAFQRTYLTAPNYPGRDWLFKFGIGWAFVD